MLEFSNEKVVGTMTIEKEITETDIENIIISSLEGGSNYWMGIYNDKEEFNDKPQDEPISTWTTKLLLDGKTVYFYCSEDNEAYNEFELTLDKLLNGIKQNTKERTWDCDLENMDVNTADCIIQYALFNEIVYG